MVSRIGLTAPQRLAVRFIGLHQGLTLGGLAELLHLHAGTVTGIVRRLESLGLVAQTRSAEDSELRTSNSEPTTNYELLTIQLSN